MVHTRRLWVISGILCFAGQVLPAGSQTTSSLQTKPAETQSSQPMQAGAQSGQAGTPTAPAATHTGQPGSQPISEETQATQSLGPALPPGEMYKMAMHPLDVVRGSLGNWSDAELGALAVGMHEAKAACAAAKPEDYTGDDLYDLAHLCSLGQDWNGAETAATRYIDSHAETYQAQAFAVKVNALVRLNGAKEAVEAVQTMLHTLPYDAEAAYTVRYLKDYLEQAGNPLALQLAVDEHAAIVQALRAGGPLEAKHGDAVMNVGLLYDSAMELAFFLKFSGQEMAAEQAKAECDAALAQGASAAPVAGMRPTSITAEDRQRIDAVRLQYGLLGSSLPSFVVTRALESRAAKPAIEGDLGAGTVFVLFPDWCAQCRTMMKTMTQFDRINASTPLHAYGLMFSEDGENPGGSEQQALYKELAGTATFVVPEATARTVGALDFPTAVVVDSNGIIRFIGMIPPDAFNGGGYMEKVFMRIAAEEGREAEREQGMGSRE